MRIRRHKPEVDQFIDPVEEKKLHENAVGQLRKARNILAVLAISAVTVGIVVEVANGDQEARRDRQTVIEHDKGNYGYPSMLDIAEDAWQDMLITLGIIGLGMPAIISHMQMKEEAEKAEAIPMSSFS